jgi:plastocyanin
MRKLLLPSLLVAVQALAACSGSSAQTTEITLKSSGMTYQPATIEVTAGQPVKLTFENMDTVDHDFSILEIPVVSTGATQEPMAGHEIGNMTTEPQLHVAAMMGQTGVLEFTPTKPGTYEFFCTVAGHKEAGMVGTLVVKVP